MASKEFNEIRRLFKSGYSLREAHDVVMHGTPHKTIAERNILKAKRNQHYIDNLHIGSIIPGAGSMINIKCPICETVGYTKNIAPLGCRTLFISCECDHNRNIQPDNEQDYDWNDYTWLNI